MDKWKVHHTFGEPQESGLGKLLLAWYVGL